MSHTFSPSSDPPEAGGSNSAVWEFVDDGTTELRVDHVEEFLLRKARIEAEVVMGRLRKRMMAGSTSETRNVSVAEVLNVWLDESIISAIKKFVNIKLQPPNLVSTQDILRFIEVELWISFYATTPSSFFDSENKDLYPPMWTAMPRSRYMEILAAFGMPRGSVDDIENQWQAPLSHDRDLTHVFELVRRLCAEIGFVERESIASLDDDMLRLRSTLVDEIGLAHVRNPKKGYGPVQHGIVSLTTGIFLGGHIAARGETTIDIVKILQRSLCGVSTESQIYLPGIFHALDRGYQSDLINSHIHNVGGKVVGTHKRTNKFPFTYGKTANPSQKAIEEKGEKAAYWASSKIPGGKRSHSLSTRAYALGYRSGLGSVTLCYTTDRKFGPGNWSYVCLRKDTPFNTQVDLVFARFESGVRMLTEKQRTPDWFLLRKFRATGSVVSRIFNQIARAAPEPDIFHDPVTDPDVKSSAMVLSLRTNQQSIDPPAVIASIALDSYTLEELKSLCRERGLPISGNKGTLKDRLRNYDREPRSPSQVSMRGEILSAWFMKPTSSAEMKIGTHNEPKIAGHVESFFAAHSLFQVEAIKSYGLLCYFLPGRYCGNGFRITWAIFAVLEYKTRVVDATQQAEQSLADTFGVFSSVKLVVDGYASDFKEQIPDASYRCQILHNIVCGGVHDGFLVYATTSRIIRVVHVFVGDNIAHTYRSAMKVIYEAYMAWVYDDTAAIPYLSLAELGSCVDLHTLTQNLALWRALNHLIQERERPLPPAKHILPSLISLWNRVKGGIDVYSRYLKNVKSRHAALPPTAAIILRVMMTLIYNAYQSLQIFEAQSFLKDTVSCSSYTAYQNHKQNLSSFASFCRDAAKCLSTQPTPAINPSSNQDEVIVGQGGLGVRYRKRVHFNSDPNLKRLQLSKRIQHDLIQIEDNAQHCCVMCCSLNHDVENATHSRKGFKTRFQCNQCSVALCRAPRWNGEESCFAKFHNIKELPDPCLVSEQLRSTRKNDNRAAPPSRKRPGSPLNTPHRRSTSARLQLHERRRSLRTSGSASGAPRICP